MICRLRYIDPKSDRAWGRAWTLEEDHTKRLIALNQSCHYVRSWVERAGITFDPDLLVLETP